MELYHRDRAGRLARGTELVTVDANGGNLGKRPTIAFFEAVLAPTVAFMDFVLACRLVLVFFCRRNFFKGVTT